MLVVQLRTPTLPSACPTPRSEPNKHGIPVAVAVAFRAEWWNTENRKAEVRSTPRLTGYPTGGWLDTAGTSRHEIRHWVP